MTRAMTEEIAEALPSFYFIRHGQSAANAAGQPAGRHDSPLTPAGVAEARRVAAHVAGMSPRPARMIVTGLSRADMTGAIINEALRLPVETRPVFQEQHYGALQGQDKEDIHARHGPHWFMAPPGGEAFTDFQARVVTALHGLLSEAEQGLPLIVGHGGMMTALGRHYGVNLRGTKNCAVYFFEAQAPPVPLPWALYSLDICEDGFRRTVIVPGRVDF